jgi:hypothetical protein
VSGGGSRHQVRPGCFVAGTLVHTKDGPLPIEKIRVGDLVLSQPQMRGELSYRRVLQTFMYEEHNVYRMSYYRDSLRHEDDKNIQPPEEAAHDL